MGVSLKIYLEGLSSHGWDLLLLSLVVVVLAVVVVLLLLFHK